MSQAPIPIPIPQGQPAPQLAYRTAGAIPVPQQAKQPFLPIPIPSPKAQVNIPIPSPKAQVNIPIPSPKAQPSLNVIPIPIPSPRGQVNVPIPIPSPQVKLNVVPAVKMTALPKMVSIPVIQPAQPRELVLRPRQVPWANRAREILLGNHGYIDNSKMRSGKTYVLLWLAKQFNFSILVIGLSSFEHIWRDTAREYGVDLIDFVTYQSLRSVRNKQPKHGYLTRHDTVSDTGKHFVTFRPTDAYMDLVNRGVLVVLDEIDQIKNNSAQYKAASAMVSPIITEGGSSRFALLSGLPFDKEFHAIQLLRLINYIRSPRLYTYDRNTRQIVLEGMQELIDICRTIDDQATTRILATIPIVKSKMNDLAYTLYRDVVMENIAGSMPPPPEESIVDSKNGFYNIRPENLQALRDGVRLLSQAVQYNEEAGTANFQEGGASLGQVTLALTQIEAAKYDDMARVATGILTNDPAAKVVLVINYTDSTDGVNILSQLLSPFNPVIMTGKTPAKRRPGVQNAFNNDPNVRVLIGHPSTMAYGISLYVQRENEPRHMLISPSYYLLRTAQVAARVHGDGALSPAYIRMFYGKGQGAQETKILDAMARKSRVGKDVVAGPAQQELVLPGDYQSEIEANP